MCLCDPLLLEAVDHLKEAIEMCAEFNNARYDLGLIYRMLDKPDEALEYFARIASSTCGKPSEYHVPLINAYEQQAICKLELKRKKSDKERKKALEYDARRCMWKALTVISAVIRTLPMLRTTRQCFPTLKILLQSQEQSSIKHWRFTQESVGFYQKNFEILGDDDPKNLKKK